jgi:L-gulono-1,4-lactone dehydrogenase
MHASVRRMWSNWAGDQRCQPAVIERPGALGEVVGAVERAVAAGRCVRVAGSGHSFTGAALTDGSLVSLERMGALLDADPSVGLVRVQAGMSIRALNEALAEHGLALPNLGDIDAQTIAGAVATATHGTGATLPNLSAQVGAVQLVTAAGEVLEIDGGEDLLAARVGLGALGVVTELTLRVVPAFTLRGVDAPALLAAVLDELEARVDGHRHFEFFVFPHADTALTRTNDAVDEPARPRSRARAHVDDILLANRAFQLACAIGRAAHPVIPTLNRLVTRAAGSSTRVDRSDRIFATPRLVRFTEMEYALPRPVAATAIRAIKATSERFAINFPIEVRFVAGDDALLSPAHERETVYVAVHAYKGMAWEPFFRAVEAIADEHDGRPHWGKRHFQTAETLASRYPGWERFAALRARLDPEGVFGNAYTDRVLGALGSPRALSGASLPGQ